MRILEIAFVCSFAALSGCANNRNQEKVIVPDHVPGYGFAKAPDPSVVYDVPDEFDRDADCTIGYGGTLRERQSSYGMGYTLDRTYTAGCQKQPVNDQLNQYGGNYDTPPLY